MIRVEGLYKEFDGKMVLYNINALFDKGKVNLIIGQSGSGKTVFMKNIVGLLKPDKGKIFYDDKDFCALSKKEKMMFRRKMGMIFQNAALFDSMSVIDNVMFPLNMFSDFSWEERRRRAVRCLERVDLRNVEEKLPNELSGGMQKRVAIARAIVLQPQYLFCDEPNSGLDPKTSIVIDELIESITHEDNITTIVNTHDMNSVLGIGENINFLYKGRAQWSGSNKEIFTAQNKPLEDFIFASDILRQMKLKYEQDNL